MTNFTEQLKLNLKRPIVFFDLETTGVHVGVDRIVEYSFLKVMLDGTTAGLTRKVNPEMPIPLTSSLIHGIYDEDVKDEPTFRQQAKNLANFLEGCDLAGYNCIKFDIPVLMEEFLRAGIEFDFEGRKVVDVQNIFHQMEQRTLKAAYKFYCNKELIAAHSAEADIVATYEVLLAQLERYANVEIEDKDGKKIIPVQNDVEALHKFTSLRDNVDFAGRMVYDEQGREIFNFGKHKGKLVEEVLNNEPSYYDWMMNGDFPLYTKKKLTEIRLRKFNK
ncbi:3'-5' exonuclease [Anseongella ginsenosidimutans]|nr:3'-5' exonuclease [Anseongella ginsenosidimutans]QEC52980.1 3'-5' exonuclease [Anseongella ginsenosidimutans]